LQERRADKLKNESVPWTKKYFPKRISEVCGQDDALKALSNFISKFGRGKARAAILYGPSGTGKTAAVYAIAADLGYEVLEVNASDFRGSEEINAIVGMASRQASLFGRQKLILVDEVDGIAGSEDRGGIQALAKVIAETRFPIVMTAGFKQDPKEVHWDSKFTSIKKGAVLIRFGKLDAESIHRILSKISKKEGIKVSDDSLRKLARHSEGDARAAINDLETFALDSKNPDEFIDALGERNKEEPMASALVKVFKTVNPQIAASAFNNVAEDPDMQFLWVEENIPREYRDSLDLYRAYDELSRADVFRGRIKNRQYWGYLRTIELMITAGIAIAKDRKYDSPADYREPKRLLEIWITNAKYIKRKSIAHKFAKKTHCSSAEATQLLPYLKVIFKKNKKQAGLIAETLELDDEEVEWLEK
jgi:replication factor C large subunit